MNSETDHMEKFSLEALAREQLARARNTSNGRTAETVHGGHHRHLRQTLLAMLAGVTLGEHDSPGEATLFVLSGRVRLSTPITSWELRIGDMLLIPPQRHDVVAVEDSAILLTVVK